MDGFDKLYSGSALATSCPGFAQANRTAAALLDKVAATARPPDEVNPQTDVLNTRRLP